MLFVVTAAVAYVPTSWEPRPVPRRMGHPDIALRLGAPRMHCHPTEEPDEIRRYLADQLASMQPDEAFGDPLDTAIPYAEELRQIRGLELEITVVHAKFKFDGAEPDSVRRQVVDGYQRRNTPDDQEALAH